MDLSSILNSIAGFQSQLAGDREKASASLEDNAVLRQDGIQALQTAANLKSEIDTADLNQQLELEARKKATAATFNVDILNPENRIAMLAREQAASVDDYLAKSARASELTSMSLLDSPLEYMISRPFAGAIQSQAEASKNRAMVIDKAIGDLNQQTQQTMQTQKAITTELTMEEAAARAQLTKLTAEDAIRVAKMNSNTAYLNDLKVLRGLDEQSLSYQLKAFEVYRHDKEYNARMEEMRANREARNKAKKDEKAGLDYYLEKYNLGAELVGRSKIPADRVDVFAARLKMKDKSILDVVELGENVWVDPNDPTGSRRIGRIAETPGKSKLILDSLQGRLAPGAERTSALLQNEASIAMEALKASGEKRITPDLLANKIDSQLRGSITKEGKKETRISGTVRKMMDNVEQDVGMSKNIYRAPDVKTLLQTIPVLGENPAFKELIVPAITVDGMTPKVDSVMRQAKLALAEGKLGIEDAANYISLFYSAATEANAVNERYPIVGLPVNKSYNVEVTTSTGWGGRSGIKKINAASAEEIKTYLLAEQAVAVKRNKLLQSSQEFYKNRGAN